MQKDKPIHLILPDQPYFDTVSWNGTMIQWREDGEEVLENSLGVVFVNQGLTKRIKVKEESLGPLST